LISIKVLKMITLGEVRSLLVAMSFLVFQIVHNAPAQMKSVTLRLAPRQSSTNSNRKSAQLIGEFCHPNKTPRKVQRNAAIGEAATYLSDYSGISLACHKRRGQTGTANKQSFGPTQKYVSASCNGLHHYERQIKMHSLFATIQTTTQIKDWLLLFLSGATMLL